MSNPLNDKEPSSETQLASIITSLVSPPEPGSIQSPLTATPAVPRVSAGLRLKLSSISLSSNASAATPVKEQSNIDLGKAAESEQVLKSTPQQ